MKQNTVKKNAFNDIKLETFRYFCFLCSTAAALTEFSPERKKKQQQQQQSDAPKKPGGKKKQPTVTKKLLRTRPAKYHYLIPPNTPEAIRIELEQRQRPVSITNIFISYAND